MHGIEELIQEWDGEYVVSAYDPPSGAWTFIAIHDRTLGMALGGCRFKTYPTPADGLNDALRLARGMTYKWAAIDFRFGGGKAVIACPGPVDARTRERLLLQLGDTIQSLGGTYGTGCDMGTTPADMAVIGSRTKWVFGLPDATGGHGDPGPWTARGVHAGMRAACGQAFGEPTTAGRTILIQGMSGMGAPLARLQAAEGAVLLLSDAIADRAQRLAAELDARFIPPDQAYAVECDVFSPCAIGGILNERSIGRLQCRVVAGSANNQLGRDADAELLHERGILYAPDFVINAGGAIAHAALEVLGWTEEEVVRRIDLIEDTIAEILTEAARRHESPLHGAVRRAGRILQSARAAARQPEPARG